VPPARLTRRDQVVPDMTSVYSFILTPRTTSPIQEASALQTSSSGADIRSRWLRQAGETLNLTVPFMLIMTCDPSELNRCQRQIAEVRPVADTISTPASMMAVSVSR
jgi:hypothetical protein